MTRSAKNPNNHPAWCNCKECCNLYAPPGGWPEIDPLCSCPRTRYGHEYDPNKCAAYILSYTDITDEEWESYKMAQLPQPRTTSNQTGQTRTRGLRFIKTDDMPKTAQRARILAAVLEPTTYSDMQCKIEFPEGSGQKWILGLKFDNDNYRRLHDGFGGDTDDWNGKAIMLSQVFSDALEQFAPFVDVAPKDEQPAEPQGKKAAAGRK